MKIIKSILHSYLTKTSHIKYFQYCINTIFSILLKNENKTNIVKFVLQIVSNIDGNIIINYKLIRKLKLSMNSLRFV